MKSFEKGLKLLNVFRDNNIENISLSELTRLSGLNKTAVIRIVSALTKYEYLVQPQKRGKYHLGPSFAAFSRIISQKQQLRQIALPHMNKLANIAKDMVVLSVLEGNQAFVVDVIDSVHLLRIALTSGTYLPLYCTGQGKVILANMTEQEIDRYIASVERRQYTKSTLIEADKLKSHLGDISKEGVAYDNGEQYAGVHNVSAGILSEEGRVFASVGVLGPAIRLSVARMKMLAPYVKQCALSISRELGNDAIKSKSKTANQ